MRGKRDLKSGRIEMTDNNHSSPLPQHVREHVRVRPPVRHATPQPLLDHIEYPRLQCLLCFLRRDIGRKGIGGGEHTPG